MADEKKYIERDAVKKKHCEICMETCVCYRSKLTCDELKTFDLIPAADVVEARHGEWVLTSYDTVVPCALGKWNIWNCSECGYRRKAGWEHTEDGKKPRARYCENCMAKMDGGEDDA